MQAVLGFASEARWLRFARRHLTAEFPYLPGQSGYLVRTQALAPPPARAPAPAGPNALRVVVTRPGRSLAGAP